VLAALHRIALGTVITRRAALAGPVTCENRHSFITVTWDGAKLTITIAPNPAFAPTMVCTLDTTKVKVTEPKGATVNADGSVTLPYDKTKVQKIVIRIEYRITCVAGGFTTILDDVATIEFTPPDGPVVVRNRPR
jgi:hypothetical protein